MKSLILLLLLNFQLSAGFFWPLDFGSKQKGHIIITGNVPEKQQQLLSLKNEKELLDQGEKEFQENNQKDTEAINIKISDVKEKLRTGRLESKDLLNKLISKLNEILQTQIDIQIYRKQLISEINQHIDILEKYLKDPSFSGMRLEAKTYYSFEDLQKINKEIAKQEEELIILIDEKSNLESSIENLKSDLNTLDKELKAKEKEQKELDVSVNVREKSELLDYEIKLINFKKRLINSKIKDTSQKHNLINSRIFVVESILKVLKLDLKKIEDSLLVNESELEDIEKQISEQKRESTEIQAKYLSEINRLTEEREKLKKEFDSLIKKYGIQVDVRLFNDWSMSFDKLKGNGKEPFIYELGYINSKTITLDKEISYKEAQREIEKENLRLKEIQAKIISSWYKISQKRFETEEEINNEKKIYEDYRNELNKVINLNKDKITASANFLNSQSRALTNLKEKIKSLNQRQEDFIKKYSEEQFNNSLLLLSKSEEQLSLQTDFNNKLTELYSSLTTNIKENLKDIEAIITKLSSSVGVLKRSEYAITWVNIKNIIPDFKAFFLDLKNITFSYISQISFTGIKEKISDFIDDYGLLNIILKFAFLIFIYLILKVLLLPLIYSALLSIRPANRILSFANSLSALLVGFLLEHLLGIFIWICMFLFIKFGVIIEFGILLIFNIISIIYLCYLTHKFVQYLINFNEKNDYIIISEVFQKRFTRIFAFLAYSTVIIFFFREAFVLLTYGKSELPIILLSIYSIIFRVSLILLIGKEEILSILPNKGFWIWIKEKINSYYYLLLAIIIAIMVISDPYIGGFTKLVTFILWGSLFTILLVIGLWWLQLLLRRVSSVIFFTSEEDEIEERFVHAKTFYGLFTIFAFIFFIFLAIFIGAKIWGISLPLERLTEIFNWKIFSVKGEGDLYIPITLKSFFTIFQFLFFGLIIAWIFDVFILKRLFDLLIVGPGIRNIISSIIYYFIVIGLVLVGLLRVDLGGLIPYLFGALAVGLAFAIKGPANDFIGYLIILAERSVKIDDYIEIDETTKGTVRKITPRSVVLKRLGGVSVIVPNAKVINSPFLNWNYYRGIIAIDDILLTVPFVTDPEKVIEILRKLLQEEKSILKSPTPIIRLEEFSENGFVFLVRCYITAANVENKWDIAANIRVSIAKQLNKNNIQFAGPLRHLILTSSTSELPSELKGIK